MNNREYVKRIERERDAKLVNELIEKNQKEMSKVSRFNAERILDWFQEKWDCDWRACMPKPERSR